MRQNLRPYQTETVDAVEEAIGDGYKRILYTLPTGTGKTTVFAELCQRFFEQGKNTLVLAHRTELISQAYERIKAHGGFKFYDIGTEIAEARARELQRIIVGSVQTCYRENRLPKGWKPQVIIVDESHHAPSMTYRRIAERFGVFDGECLMIGCTATAKRTDKQSLYAVDVHGRPVLLSRKGQRPAPADPAESVFEKHVYDFTMLDAINGGWLVPVRGHTVRTETDLTGVKTRGGDFVEGELAGKVDNNQRTLLAIAGWKKVAAGRPTLVFCASVEHAHHAAKLWQEAGYRAAAVDGETDKYERRETFRKFATGELDVLCNMGIATEGTDLPNCACIVHLRPTKSWSLYMQMTGRGTRTLPGVLDALQEADPALRIVAIEASAKPDTLVIDLVDLYDKCGDLCSVPSILDLPINLDLEGHSVTEAKEMLDEFEEVRERVIGECPTSYRELKVRLQKVRLMHESGAVTTSAGRWKSAEWGFRYTGLPVGYGCDLIESGHNAEGMPSEYRLEVTHKGKIISRSHAPMDPSRGLKSYLDFAALRAYNIAKGYEDKRPKGTWDEITENMRKCLAANGHTRDEVNKWTLGWAKIKAGQYSASFWGRKKRR